MQLKSYSCLFIFSLFVLVSNIHAQTIPTPKEHFGFTIGDDYMLANYTQTEAYFKKIAAASDRTKLVELGKTEEGRSQFMLIVTSPENLKKLDRYKEISQRLAHAENLTDDQARALAAEGKTVVWIDGGLHATEVVGAHQLIETAYQLVSRKDPETMRILDQVIILITHANPDGQELVSNWYMREAKPEKRTTDQLPRLYEKYAGHDNNRDFYMLNLKETQNIARQLFVEWLPQIMYNHHQAGPAGSVVAGPPYRDPFNYVFDPLVMTSLDAVGAAMNTRLNAEGKPGYTQRAGSVYSTWYNGGLRTTTYFHNMVGLLTEIIGSPTPATIPLVPQRLIPSGATPFPVTPQKWQFRQSIDYSVSLNYAVLGYAQRYHDDLLYNIYQMGKNSIERGQKDYWTLSPKRSAEITELYQQSLKASGSSTAPAATPAGGGRENTIPVRFFDSVMKNPASRDARGYIIPADQKDLAGATRFINALIGNGIIVQKATAAFTVAGKEYPAGSYVVKTNQAFRPHVLDMFEPQDHPNDFAYPGGPPIPPYDAAGWTLAYTMGVKFDRLLDPFDGPFQRIPFGELQTVKGTITAGAGAKGYLLEAKANKSYTVVNELLKEGAEVFRLTDSVKGSDAGLGSFFVPATTKTKALVEKAVIEHGVIAAGIDKKPASLQKIGTARIAIWDNYGGSMPSGWVRYIMEQYRFAVDIIYAKDIDTGNLRSKYDVIVFVGGAIPPPPNAGTAGFRGGGFGREPKPEDIPQEFRQRIGRITVDKSIPELKKFLEAGGNVVTIGSSTNLAYHLGVPVRDALVEMVNGQERRLPNEKYYIPGSVLQVTLDPANEATWGMNKETDVYFDASPVFNITPAAAAKGIAKPLAWFATNKPLRSGWAWGQSYLQDGVAAFVATVGNGKLYAFGPEITFRAQTHGTFKLLFNELYVNR